MSIGTKFSLIVLSCISEYGNFSIIKALLTTCLKSELSIKNLSIVKLLFDESKKNNYCTGFIFFKPNKMCIDILKESKQNMKERWNSRGKNDLADDFRHIENEVVTKFEEFAKKFKKLKSLPFLYPLYDFVKNFLANRRNFISRKFF